MLLYVLYTCVHLTARNPAPEAGRTRCVEEEVFFHADRCRKELPGRDGLKKTRYAWSWLECQEARADSWMPAAADAGANRLYRAEVEATDEQALTALLAPLSPRARATLRPADFKSRFQRTFQGPGRWSFFVVGSGSTVAVFAVSNLDDFQFADLAADFSSSSAAIPGAGLDFASMAKAAGIELSYHTEMSRRAMPPPGGMRSVP